MILYFIEIQSFAFVGDLRTHYIDNIAVTGGVMSKVYFTLFLFLDVHTQIITLFVTIYCSTKLNHRVVHTTPPQLSRMHENKIVDDDKNDDSNASLVPVVEESSVGFFTIFFKLIHFRNEEANLNHESTT